jgi:hypothetical protein
MALKIKIVDEKAHQLSADLEEPEDLDLQIEIDSDTKKPRTTGNFPSQFGKDCGNPLKPKVAVLFYGLYRTFGDQDYESLRLRHFFEPLKSKGAQGITNPTADIFAHVKTGAIPTSEVDAGMKKSQVVNYTAEEGAGTYGDEEDTTYLLKKPECFHGKHTKPNKLQHMLGRDWSVQEAHRMMEQHETNMKQQYDVVLFSRADLRFFKDIDLSDVNCETGKVYHDMFVALPRKYSHLMRDIMTDLYFSEEPFACGLENAEDVWLKATLYWQKKLKVPIAYTSDVGPGSGSTVYTRDR